MKVYGKNVKGMLIGVFFCGCLLVALALLECSKKESTTPTGGDITVTGQLNSGSVIVNPLMVPLNTNSLNPLGLPLTGYTLYCVTFSNTPASAKSPPADANGNVSLTIAAQNISFGCFILDTGDTVVAALVFSGTTGAAQGMKLSASADLGTITVDVETGLAQADLPEGGTLVSTTPSGVECPLGRWEGTFKGSPCALGKVTITMWIAKLSSGDYTVSLTADPVCVDHCSTCGYASYMNIMNATYQSGVLTFSVSFEPESCPDNVATITLTPEPTCQAATLTIISSGCGDCTGGGCDGDYPGCGAEGETGDCNGCGSTPCSQGPYSLTKN